MSHRKNGQPIHILHSFHVKYPHGIAMLVVGRSMEPTLRDDDGVLIDTAQTDPSAGEIVCVDCPALGGRLVGRFHRSQRGAWLAKDNESFPTMFLGPSDRYSILGTVVALCARDTTTPKTV